MERTLNFISREAIMNELGYKSKSGIRAFERRHGLCLIRYNPKNPGYDLNQIEKMFGRVKKQDALSDKWEFR